MFFSEEKNVTSRKWSESAGIPTAAGRKLPVVGRSLFFVGCGLIVRLCFPFVTSIYFDYEDKCGCVLINGNSLRFAKIKILSDGDFTNSDFLWSFRRFIGEFTRSGQSLWPHSVCSVFGNCCVILLDDVASGLL